MVKMIKRILLIIVLLLVAITIKAYANELTIVAPDSINTEETNEIECTLKGNFSDNINSIKVRYNFSDGITFDDFTPNESWTMEQGGTSNSSGMILRVGDENVTGEIEFGKFILHIPETYDNKKINIKLFDLDATNKECEIIDFENDPVEKEIVIENNDDKEDEEEDNPLPDDSDNQKDEDNKEDESTNNNGAEVDNTASDKPFGQFGDKSIILIVVALVAAVAVLLRKNIKYKDIK